MKHWTTSEIHYLEVHAEEGAEAIAEALGRSVDSVAYQASQYRISLRKRWYCPKCGRWVFKPLSHKTGWCASCTKAERRGQLQRDIEDMREEAMRERDEDRKRQALYAQKNRLKKKETK